MAAYIEKAKALRGYIDELVKDYPGLEEDPRLGWVVYFSVLGMPRCQGTVRKNFVQTSVGHLYDVRTVTKTKDYGPNAGETYQGLEIHKKHNKKLFSENEK